jgi:UDP-glucose 4-epimerase
MSALDHGHEVHGLDSVDCVLHHAAIASIPQSMHDPLQNHESNATGTLHLLLAARDAGVRRVIFASSSSVYGDQTSLPIHEGLPLDLLSPYAFGSDR